MRKIDLKELKEILLEVMDEIHEICEKHNLRYYLAGGTLIGAVRHNGFIPWDDDMDIHMPRPDYDKFMQIYPKEGKNVLYEHCINENYKYPYAKLCKKGTRVIEKGGFGGVDMGVFIDIFPLDALGNNEKEAKSLMRKLVPYVNLNLSLLVEQWRDNVSFVKNFAIWNLHNVALMAGGHKKLLKKIDKIIRTYDYESSSLVGEFIDEIQYKRIVKKKLYDARILHEFEGRQYYIPADYDAILTQFYGDYMTPPPEEKRVVVHGFDAFVIEEKNKGEKL